MYIYPLKIKNIVLYCIVWFENNDLTKPIVEYQINVHLFVAASFPGAGK